MLVQKFDLDMPRLCYFCLLLWTENLLIFMLQQICIEEECQRTALDSQELQDAYMGVVQFMLFFLELLVQLLNSYLFIL